MSGHVSAGRRNRFWIVTLTLVILGFGLIVLWKQALMRRPQGDFGVFARAGWAIRQGQATLYRVRDDNTWHYNYPPTFALLMTPFADPPRRHLALTTATALGQSGAPLQTVTAFAACPNPILNDQGRYLPYWLSSVLYYLANVGCLMLAVHLLVGALWEQVPASKDDNESNRRWWWWRVAPSMTCLPAIGLNLMRGQVQILLLLLLCGMLTCLLRGRRFRAGLCLAGAIGLKIIPVFLLLVPLVRRDFRCLAGCAVGLVIGLILVPVVVLGAEQTVLLYADFGTMMLGPALGLNVDAERAKELLNATATQSQSFQVVLHKTLHLGVEKIPPEPARWVKTAHQVISGSLTLALLWRSRGFRQGDGLELAGWFGLLTTLMLLSSPVCHLHYLVLLVPMTTAMIVKWEVEQPEAAHWDKWAMSTVLVLALSLPMVPGLGIMRNVGVPMYAVLLWWFVGLSMDWRRSGIPDVGSMRRAA